MTGPAAVHEIDDLELMLHETRLVDIYVFSFAARRKEDADAVEVTEDYEATMSLAVSARWGPGSMEPRFAISVETPDAVIEADMAARYRIAADAVLSARLQAEFIEHVGVMTVFPYLRESVSTSAARLGIRMPPLDLLKRGEFKIQPDDGSESLPTVVALKESPDTSDPG